MKLQKKFIMQRISKEIHNAIWLYEIAKYAFIFERDLLKNVVQKCIPHINTNNSGKDAIIFLLLGTRLQQQLIPMHAIQSVIKSVSWIGS